MRRIGSIIAFLFGISLLSASQFAATVQAQTGARVTFGINPTIFRADQPASAELSVSSMSVAPLSLYAGTTFMFFVDGAIGTVVSTFGPIAVESASLLPTDFAFSQNPALGLVTITYEGSPKVFAFGESFSVKISFTVNAKAGPGKVGLSSQFDPSVNGDLPFVSVSVVDFANSGTSSVVHDATLTGDGTSAMPLGIAPGGVTTTDLATGAVTSTKISAGAVTAMSIAPSAVTATSIAPGAVTAGAIAPNAVTAGNIAAGQVVKTINSNLTDAVTIAAGSNIGLATLGNTLTISGTVDPVAGFSTSNNLGFSAFGIIINPGNVVVASKDVPSGSYVIFYRGQLINSDTGLSGHSHQVDCALSTGDHLFMVLGTDQTNGSGIMTLQDVATFVAPTTTISVVCGGQQGFAKNNVLTAIKVASIQ